MGIVSEHLVGMITKQVERSSQPRTTFQFYEGLFGSHIRAFAAGEDESIYIGGAVHEAMIHGAVCK